MAQHNVQLEITQSTFVDKLNPSTNYGNLEYLRSGSETEDLERGSWRYTILLNWDHNIVPPRKKILVATLALYSRKAVTITGTSDDALITPDQGTAGWDESTATYNNTFWYASWPAHYKYSENLPQNSMIYFNIKPNLIYEPYGIIVAGPRGEAEFNSTRAASNKPYIDVVYEDVPPNAPTPTEPIGLYKDSKSIIRFAWQYNSDVGGTQKKFDLEWSTDQSTWTTVSQTTANNYYDMPADTFPAGNVYWRVRCYNEHDEVGDYCPTQSFYAIGAPNAPAIDTIPTDTARPTVTWAAFSQQVYQLQVLSGDTIVYDSGVVPGINIRQHKIKAWLADGEYTVRIRIKNEYDLWSEWGSAAVTITTVKPEKPTVTAAKTIHGIKLTIDSDDTDYTLVYRDGVCIGKTTDNEYNDNAAICGRKHEYFIRGVYEQPSYETFNDSNAATETAEFKHALIAPVSDLTNVFAFTRSLNAPPKRTYNRQPGGAMVQYAGRKYPVWEPTEHVSAGWSMTFYLKTWADVETFIAIYDLNSTVLYRDAKGRKIYGTLNNLSVNDDILGYIISFTINQVDYDEEVEV